MLPKLGFWSRATRTSSFEFYTKIYTQELEIRFLLAAIVTERRNLIVIGKLYKDFVRFNSEDSVRELQMVMMDEVLVDKADTSSSCRPEELVWVGGSRGG